MRQKLFLTRRLPDTAMLYLEENFEVRCNPENRVLTHHQILDGVNWCDILLCLLTDKIDSEILRANPSLKGVVNYAVGYNNIDVKEATILKIPVTNTPGVLTDTTADLAWALMFEADSYVRAGKFHGWAPLLMLGGDVYGKVLGIVGAGRIGSAVAQRAVGFSMKVLYTDNKRNYELEEKNGAKKVPLDTLLRSSDFVSLHVPLLPETIHIISNTELNIMKKSAYLINTSRGPVINETDLLEALQNNKIAGAGLDVYEHEPELSTGLADLTNVVLVPHIASASIDTRTKMGMMAAENAIAIRDGVNPPNLINPEIK